MNAQVKTDSYARNLDHVRQIAHDIEYGITYEEGYEGFDPEYPEQLMSGFDWLADALDIEYIVNSDRTFKSARVMVAYGGPTIWVDFSRGQVELWWWGEYARAGFNEDAMGIEDALQELWGCL